MDIAHMGAGRTRSHLAHSEDIDRLRCADQGAQTTSLPETETATPDTSHNPSTDRTPQPSNVIGCKPSGRSVDIVKGLSQRIATKLATRSTRSKS
jgi:hypothetical protein